ncbi:MAG: Xaa-Pro peptidase family protein [Arenicellales bacterium]|nr:Xaa-Pro peptidase family protein [Arenicellales bacterium]
MTDWHYRAFSKVEHNERITRARTLMASKGLAGCICTSPELLYYFTGYEAHTHHAIGSQAMVMAAERDEPILILRDGDLPQADETVVVGRIHPFRLGAVELGMLIKAAVSELGLTGKPLGLDGSGPTMNGELAQSLEQALSDSELHDCWRLLGRLRTVLSAQEIVYLKEATVYANAGIDAFYETARTGMSEIELAAEIEYAMRAAGSDYPAVPTWMASGPRAYCQHAMATPRKLEKGDLVHAEFAGVARRYHSVTMGSLVMGEPNKRMVEMADGAKAAFEAGLAAVSIGRRIGDAEAAYRECLNERGLGDCCPMRFGVGISAAYPPVWENQVTIQYETEDRFELGMAFYIHASMQSMRDREGMLLGGSFLMTEAGPERLDKARMELVTTPV